MADLILIARLDALEQNLRRAEGGRPSWWDSVQVELPSIVREGLNKAITNQAREHLKALRDIRTRLKEAGGQENEALVLKEAWRDYAEIYDQCQKFFGECLEVIGGLAFRGSGLEERLYQVADELVRNCASESTNLVESVAPIVPALPETLIKTMARIIGLRFPEWTIWTLPFTAHELGHVVICEDDYLRGFIKQWVGEWANEGAERQAENHLLEFSADAFATYTMGPAYACAVILLRFNPLAAGLDQDESPGDARRAHVVFTMLERMNGEAGVADPYGGVVESLREYWGAILKGAGQPDKLEDPEAERLKKLVDGIWDQFGEWLYPTAKYPAGGDSGWLVAEKWYRTWLGQLKEGHPLDIEDVSGRNALRDVLNAAWLCRLEYLDQPQETANIEKFAEAAQKLCEAIIEERSAEEAPEPARAPASTHKMLRPRVRAYRQS